MSVIKLFILGIASLALVACDHMNIAEIHQKTITGSDYRSHLANKYKAVVKYEAEEMVDLPDAAHFATKAMAVLNNKESSQALAAETKADKLKGRMTKTGVDFGISKYGSAGTDLEMALPDNYMGTRLTKVVKNDPLVNYFKNLPPVAVASTMDPTGNVGNVISTNMVNSGNNYNTTGFAINSSGSNDAREMKKVYNNPAGLF